MKQVRFCEACHLDNRDPSFLVDHRSLASWLAQLLHDDVDEKDDPIA